MYVLRNGNQQTVVWINRERKEGRTLWKGISFLGKKLEAKIKATSHLQKHI
jgi:hypothetical protein